MPQGPDGKTIIIVKKVSGHGGHHGGAWKVAYADFVTAMMALFLVLWLVNSASVTTRERIASYFKRPGVFEKGSGTPLEMGGSGILPDTFAPPAIGNSQIIPTKDVYNVETEGGLKAQGFRAGAGEGGGSGDTEGVGKEEGEGQSEEAMLRQLASELQAAAGTAGAGSASAMSGLLGEVSIKVDQRGLHIDIMDTPTASMFQVGSSEIMGEAEAELLKIAAKLAELPNPIDIEGHTDSRPFRTKRKNYDNWDLSTDRANAARRILEKAGIKDEQIARVVGYAERRPKNSEDLMHPSNRRISISMRFSEQAAAALKGTNTVETAPKPIVAPGVNENQVPAPAEKILPPVQATPAVTETPAIKPDENTDKREEGKLKVEIETRIPEDAVIEINPNNSGREQWMEKDKIFGNQNPFFRP